MSVNSYYLRAGERIYYFQDAPGHLDYSDTLFTQVLRPDAGVLVVEAHTFERTVEQIQQHLGYLVVFAIKQIVIIVNKMDKVNYEK